MIEFNCEICGAAVRKAWSDSMPGRPRFCSIACKAESQRRARPVTREWLEGKYIAEGLDCVQIGKLVDRDPKSVWNWMQDWGIPTRPRGSDPRQHFKAGHTDWVGRHHTEGAKQKIREARYRDGGVPYLLKDGTHAMKGRTGAEHPGWKGGLTPERQAFYATQEWKDACCAVWARADAKCERCGVDHRELGRRGTFHVHHVVSFMVRELRAEVGNLALLCADCHRFVHSRGNVGGEFLRGE